MDVVCGMQMLIGSGSGRRTNRMPAERQTRALCGCPARQRAFAAPADPNGTRQVTVPEGDGAPVITDGIFSPGEWDDSLPIAVNETVVLRLKHYRGVVSSRAQPEYPQRQHRPLRGLPGCSGGQINRLHVSAQLYETALPLQAPNLRPASGSRPTGMPTSCAGT